MYLAMLVWPDNELIEMNGHSWIKVSLVGCD